MDEAGGRIGVAGRLTRRALLAAASAAILAWRLGEHAWAATYDHRFGRLPNQPGWGPAWFSPHYTLGFDTQHGEGRMHVRAGLQSTAPAQTMPVFLLDHQCKNSAQEIHFRVTNTTVRPGILFRRRDASHFFGVTYEDDQLVLASYSRANRHAIARVPVRRLGPNRHVMRVVVSGRSVSAGVWLAGGAPQVQLYASLPGSGIVGTPGVLLVAPTDRREASLLVSRYILSSPSRFRKTAPHATFLVTGTPVTAGGMTTIGVKAQSDIPASIRFEWSHDPRFRTGVEFSDVHQPDAPYTARTDIELATSKTVYWRARLVSNRGGTTRHSRVMRFRPHDVTAALVMGAASCAQLWGHDSFDAFGRLMAAAPATPAIVVFQGDLGYAGNERNSTYLQAPDFYMERFSRTLADPHFSKLRQRVPVGFTADDHDYAQKNNAAPQGFPRWSIGLWDHVHADPTVRGYNDWRFGDVHCLTLDGRRYADSVFAPNTPDKTKLGLTQRDWLENILRTTDAHLIVIFSADCFASRINLDNWMFGWPNEYRRLMTEFMSTQLRGVRVVILSGDAHGMRIHHHPDPVGRSSAHGFSIVEFICSGVAPRSWSMPDPSDTTLDPTRIVMNRRGLGMIHVDPPSAAPHRSIRLRAISGAPGGPVNLFTPLDLSFHPSAGAG